MRLASNPECIGVQNCVSTFARTARTSRSFQRAASHRSSLTCSQPAATEPEKPNASPCIHLTHSSTRRSCLGLLLSHVVPLMVLNSPAHAEVAQPLETATSTGEQLAAVTADSLPDLTVEPPVPALTAAPWWENGADAWVELGSADELQAFLLAPGKASNKLLAVEFYARGCAVCASKSVELLQAVSDTRVSSLCTFARVDVDAVNDGLQAMGIKHVPSIFIYSPEGYKLIDFNASEAALREAVASLSTVFHGPTPIPTAYQADLANLPPTADLSGDEYSYDGGDEGADEGADDVADWADEDGHLDMGLSVAGGSTIAAMLLV